MQRRPIVVDHVDLRVRDLEQSSAFYQAVLAPLGFSLLKKTSTHASFGADGADDFGLHSSDLPTQNVHIAFAARSAKALDDFYAEALKFGVRDNGAPGAGRSTTLATTERLSSMKRTTTSKLFITGPEVPPDSSLQPTSLQQASLASGRRGAGPPCR